MTFPVPAEYSGLRLDKVLVDEPFFKDVITTRSYAQNMIEKGYIAINGERTKSSYALKEADNIDIFIPEVKPTELIPYDYKLDIIFEDDHLIVINKPAGLVVHPSAGHEQNTLVNALLHHTKNLSMKNEERPGIVHRIDKETSGLLVVAKNDYAHEHLSLQFKNKTTHRVYYAVVEGRPRVAKATISTYLGRHPNDRKKFSSVRINNRILTEFEEGFEKGKWAVTHYQTIQSSQSKSLVRVQLETGRTHQIRVHLSEIGHPLLGDMTYGFSAKKAKELGITRFYLHAAELGFIHPKTKEPMKFLIDWPRADFEKIKSWGFIL
ncbi:RluA family pseudouridine synthase [Bdellovibrio sp. qaytius]|nr:RluA family pseudouridine synthase [Bdellovibrio sp. qaytius]